MVYPKSTIAPVTSTAPVTPTAIVTEEATNAPTDSVATDTVATGSVVTAVVTLEPTLEPTPRPTEHEITWADCDNIFLRHRCHGDSGEGTACRWDSSQHLCFSRDENSDKYFCLQFDIDHTCDANPNCVWAFRSKTCVALVDVHGAGAGGVRLSNSHLQQTKGVVRQNENVILFLSCFSLGLFISTCIFCYFRPKKTSAKEAILLDNI